MQIKYVDMILCNVHTVRFSSSTSFSYDIEFQTTARE